MPRPSGMTLQLHVGDVDRARRLYGVLLAGGLEFEPHEDSREDFLEWRIGEGETWLQVLAAAGPLRPVTTRMRFRVGDLAAARAAVEATGTWVSEVTTLPGVVRWVDFTAPWGSELGCFEDLAPTGQAASPGGSVQEPRHFS